MIGGVGVLVPGPAIYRKLIVFSIKLERIGKHKGSRKVLWLKQRYFMSCADKTFLIIINTKRSKQARKDLQFLNVSKEKDK